MPAKSQTLALTTAAVLLGSILADVRPAEKAQDHVGEVGTYEFLVKASKNAVSRKTVFLDSEEDFRDDKNLAILIGHEHLAKFQAAKIDDPAKHYKGKTIRVTGKVISEMDQIRIRVDDPEQIVVVEKPAKP
jgi:hypothetical protein